METLKTLEKSNTKMRLDDGEYLIEIANTGTDIEPSFGVCIYEIKAVAIGFRTLSEALENALNRLVELKAHTS